MKKKKSDSFVARITVLLIARAQQLNSRARVTKTSTMDLCKEFEIDTIYLNFLL